MNTHRNLIKAIVAILILVPVAIASTYFMRQNAKRHHYITGIIQYGPHRGETMRYTEEQQDKINEAAHSDVMRVIDAENRIRAAHRR